MRAPVSMLAFLALAGRGSDTLECMDLAHDLPHVNHAPEKVPCVRGDVSLLRNRAPKVVVLGSMQRVGADGFRHDASGCAGLVGNTASVIDPRTNTLPAAAPYGAAGRIRPKCKF